MQPENALVPMLVTLLPNGDARQASAAIECALPDAGDAVGNVDARDFRAPVEGIVGYLHSVLRDINTSDVIVKIGPAL